MSRLSLALAAGAGALVTWIALRRRRRRDPTASVPRCEYAQSPTPIERMPRLAARALSLIHI